MRNRTKLMLAGLTAALTLGALVSAASASRIAIVNNNNGFKVYWNNLVFRSSVANVECHVTIEGSFHSRTISKVAEQLIGYVTRAIVDEGHCTGGSARVLAETLPWHIRYDSFTGTLPKIASIKLRLVGTAFMVNLGGVSCLFTSSAASPMKGVVNINTTTGVVENLKPEAAAIPLTSGGPLCPTSGTLEGVSTSITLLGTTAKITVTLVQ